MSRQLRVQFPGAVFHVTSRGNEKRDIFFTDDDHRLFLELLGDAVDRFKWIVTAYALMSNHYHLLLELTAETLPDGMRWLNGTYVQEFNRRHGRTGHLIGERPDEQLIEKETYHLNVLKYVVLNPVRAAMVRSAGDYEWSSYRATAGLAPVPEWLAVDEVLRVFAPTRDLAREMYRRFVVDTPQARSPWADLVGQMYLGSETWVRRMKERVEGQIRDTEHPLRQRQVRRYEMADVIAAVAVAFHSVPAIIRNGRGGVPRMVAAWLATYECLLRQPAIAAGLRLRSAARITAMVKACDEALRSDSELQKRVDACRDALYTL